MSPGVYVSYRGRPRVSLGGLGYLRPRRRRRRSSGAGLAAIMMLVGVAVLVAGALILLALALVPFLIGFMGEFGDWTLRKTVPPYRRRRDARPLRWTMKLLDVADLIVRPLGRRSKALSS